MDKNEIGKIIFQFRKKKGLTQCQLASYLFVTDKAVSKWERGISYPNIDVFLKLCELLNICFDDFKK